MALRSRVLIALCVVMVRGGTIHADMMPVSPRDAGPRGLSCVTACRWSADLLGSFDDRCMADLDLLPIEWSPDSPNSGRQADEVRAVQLTSDGQNSLGLCLYALLSLGLCRSAPLVRKLSFGFVPQWYYDGGLVRVGECLASSPDCLCAATICCFIQPDFGAEDPMSRHRFNDVARLWLSTQFTPAVLAARAPPIPSWRLSAA